MSGVSGFVSLGKNSGSLGEQHAPNHRAISPVPGGRITRDTLLREQGLGDEMECGERIMGRLETMER